MKVGLILWPFTGLVSPVKTVISFFLLVKGIVDIPQEIEKLQKKRSKICEFSDAILKRQAGDGYTLNVKEEVKVIDNNKV